MSILSLVGLALGVVSPLALFAPLLLVLPITAIAVCLLSLRRIALSEGTLVGRGATLFGLAFAIASISAVITRSELTQELLSRQARVTALAWIETLQAGDAEKAFKMTTTGRQGPPPEPPGAPGDEPGKSPLDSFRNNPVVHFLLDRAAGAAVKYVGDSGFDLASGSDARVQQVFTVSAKSDSSAAQGTSIEIVLLRDSGATETSEWLVSAYRSDDLPSDTEADRAAFGHAG